MFSNAEDDLLDTSFDPTDKKGILVAKMKTVLSRISGSGDNIEEFMKKVESTLGQVLGLSKAIMDQLSQVVHLSRLNLFIINQLHASWTIFTG
jgi:phage-related minor tail protein